METFAQTMSSTTLAMRYGGGCSDMTAIVLSLLTTSPEFASEPKQFAMLATSFAFKQHSITAWALTVPSGEVLVVIVWLLLCCCCCCWWCCWSCCCWCCCCCLWCCCCRRRRRRRRRCCFLCWCCRCCSPSCVLMVWSLHPWVPAQVLASGMQTKRIPAGMLLCSLLSRVRWNCRLAASACVLDLRIGGDMLSWVSCSLRSRCLHWAALWHAVSFASGVWP